MKYKIDTFVFYMPESVAEFCYSAGCFGTDDFDKELDCIYNRIALGKKLYDYSYVFKQTDEAAYMHEYKNWADELLDEARKGAIVCVEMLECAGDEVDINGYTVVAVDDEEEQK